MARCPKCDSKEVYRHVGFRKSRYFLCRNCMSDLVETNAGFTSARTVALIVVILIEFMILVALNWPPLLMVVAGFAALVPAMHIADLFSVDLQALPRHSTPINRGDTQIARTTWFGLRRRNEPPTP